jgi:hypothetical protein
MASTSEASNLLIGISFAALPAAAHCSIFVSALLVPRANFRP